DQHPAREWQIDVRPDRSVPHAALEKAVDRRGIITQHLAYGLTIEFCRLPRFEEENGREVRVGFDPRELKLDEATEALLEHHVLIQKSVSGGAEPGHLLAKSSEEEVILPLEVKVYGPLGDPCGPRDVAGSRVDEALPGEYRDRRVQDRAVLGGLLAAGGCIVH